MIKVEVHLTRKLIEIASEIVQTQVSITSMSADEIASSLREVFKTLQGMLKSETEGTDLELTQVAGALPSGEKAAPSMAPADSIQKDKIICLECGKEARQLTAKHLAVHDMSPREYRLKYGFTMRTPLCAKSLTKARSKAATKRGLPENLSRFIEERRKSKAAATPSTASPEGTGQKKIQTRLKKKSKV